MSTRFATNGLRFATPLLLCVSQCALARTVALTYESGTVQDARSIPGAPGGQTDVLPRVLIIPWDLVELALRVLDEGVTGRDIRKEAERLAMLLERRHRELPERVPDTVLVIWGHPRATQRKVAALSFGYHKTADGAVTAAVSGLEASRAKQLNAWGVGLKRVSPVPAEMERPKPGVPFFARFEARGTQIETGPFLCDHMATLLVDPHVRSFDPRLGTWELTFGGTHVGEQTRIRYSPLYGAVFMVTGESRETGDEPARGSGIRFLRLVAAYDSAVAGPVPVNALARATPRRSRELWLWLLIAVPAVSVPILFWGARMLRKGTRREKKRTTLEFPGHS